MFIFVLKGITSNFWLAIFLLLLALFAKGFHAFGSATNPVDIAPKHAGAISGVSYSTAATAGWKSKLILYKYQSNLNKISIQHHLKCFKCMFLSFVGFLGVYLAGYILDITGSWAAVFNTTAVINLFGIVIFFIFGSGTPIV